MSTIVVTSLNGENCIAADTATRFGGLIPTYENRVNPTKMLEVGDTRLGLPGTAANLFVLKSYFQNPDVPCDFSSEFAAFETLRAAHDVLKEKYFMNASDGDSDEEYEITQVYGLGANPHGIFSFHTFRSTLFYAKYWALGAGQEYALGAMHAGFSKATSAEELARIGLEAAAELDDSTEAPFEFHTFQMKS